MGVFPWCESGVAIMRAATPCMPKPAKYRTNSVFKCKEGVDSALTAEGISVWDSEFLRLPSTSPMQ